MRKKILYIVLLIMMVLTACGKTENVEEKDDKKQVKIEEEKKTVEEDVSSEKEILDDKDSQSTADAPVVQEPSNQTESNENQSNKNETTTKPSTGNSGSSNTGNINNSNSSNNNTGNTNSNSGSATTQPSTPVHKHTWTEVRETIVTQEAWVEDVYGWRTLCGKCNLDMTEMTDEELIIHCSFECNSCYSAKYIKYDEINHPAVTEEQVTGYKCECGAEKK